VKGEDINAVLRAVDNGACARDAQDRRRAQAFASLVALAERSSVLSVNFGQIAGRNWCATINFVSGDLLDAVADSPEAAVKAVEAKMREHEDIQSGLMEDT